MHKSCEKLKSLAPVFLRLGLGIIFLYHGYHKVLGAGTNWGTSWNNSGMSTIVQALVAWGELLGGGAILIGFLTEIAALGIIIIMVGAIVLVHGKNGFGMMNHGFEYNFALIMMALTLIAIGSGPYSLGCNCKKE